MQIELNPLDRSNLLQYFVGMRKRRLADVENARGHFNSYPSLNFVASSQVPCDAPHLSRTHTNTHKPKNTRTQKTTHAHKNTHT